MYKVSFHIYRIVLIAVIPLYFFAKFMVGTAGHNSNVEITDYFVAVFVILTSVLLLIFQKSNKKRNDLRFAIVVLLAINIAFFVYQLYDFWLLYKRQNFGMADNIPVAIIMFLIVLCSIVISGLLKNKF